MEQLETELKSFVDKLADKKKFYESLQNLKSVEPFNKYEFIISTLLAENIISYDNYIAMRDSYRFRNVFLDVFNLGKLYL